MNFPSFKTPPPPRPQIRRDSFQKKRESYGGPWDFSVPQATLQKEEEQQLPLTPATLPPQVVSGVDPAVLMRSLDGEQDGTFVSASDDDFFDVDDERTEKKKPKGKRKATTTTKRKVRGPKGMVDNPVCGHCGTKTTPEWRSGPNGLLLCNACGLKWSRKRQKGVPSK